MNFYDFLNQQYKDYKIGKVTLRTRCDTCPCKTLRDKMFDTHKLRRECYQEMMYLVIKNRIPSTKITSCNDLRGASLEIAKKMAERNNRI